MASTSWVASLFFLVSTFAATAGEICEVIGKSGASVFVYCPSETTPQKMGELIQKYRDQYFDRTMNQIHIYVFNNKEKTPKSGKDFANLSDAVIHKFQTGIYDLNKNTGHSEFQCRKPKTSTLQACNVQIN